MNENNNPSTLLTTEEVIQLLRISKRTLQTYRSEYRIPFLRISSKVIRYREIDVLNFLLSTTSNSYLRDKCGKLLAKYRIKH